MSDLIRDSVLYGNGIEFHITLDPQHRVYCESKALARQVVSALNNLGMNAVVGKPTAIQSKMNGPIQVVPVNIGDVKGNSLIIRIADNLPLAYGIAELFRDPQVHHMGMKAIPLNDNKRRSGRRNHSARR